MTLVLKGAVAQFTKAVEEDGVGERVAGLALIEDAAGAAPLLGIVESVEHEQGTLDPPDLAQGVGDRVLAREARSSPTPFSSSGTSRMAIGLFSRRFSINTAARNSLSTSLGWTAVSKPVDRRRPIIERAT